jgi:hypothetical protein
MPSKMVVDRQRREKALRGLLEENRGKTVEGVVEHLAPYADEDVDLAGCVDGLLRTLERRLADHTDELIRADERNAAGLDRLDLLRLDRDEAARVAGDRFLGIRGHSPRAHDPRRLMSQVHAALDRLQDPDRKLPKKTRVALPMTEEEIRDLPKTWSRSLETALNALRKLMRRIGEGEKQIEATRHDKDVKMELHDTELSAIANLQEALLILGRKPEAARIIWQKQRPVGRPARQKKRKRRARKQTGKASKAKTTTQTTPSKMSSGEVAKS